MIWAGKVDILSVLINFDSVRNFQSMFYSPTRCFKLKNIAWRFQKRTKFALNSKNIAHMMQTFKTSKSVNIATTHKLFFFSFTVLKQFFDVSVK